MLGPCSHQVDTAVQDAPAEHRGVIGQQSHDGESQGALASPAFAHEAVGLALFLAEADAVERVHRASGTAKLHLQIFDSEGFYHRRCSVSD